MSDFFHILEISRFHLQYSMGSGVICIRGLVALTSQGIRRGLLSATEAVPWRCEVSHGGLAMFDMSLLQANNTA